MMAVRLPARRAMVVGSGTAESDVRDAVIGWPIPPVANSHPKGAELKFGLKFMIDVTVVAVVAKLAQLNVAAAVSPS